VFHFTLIIVTTFGFLSFFVTPSSEVNVLSGNEIIYDYYQFSFIKLFAILFDAY